MNKPIVYWVLAHRSNGQVVYRSRAGNRWHWSIFKTSAWHYKTKSSVVRAWQKLNVTCFTIREEEW